MPTSVGVDLVKISLLEAMLADGGSSFRAMCWTPDELIYCNERPSRLAATWAAKEATMKALGCGLGEIDPIDIEVSSREGQKPVLLLHGLAQSVASRQDVDLALSMSHEDDMAVAFVVATPRPSTDLTERN